MSVQLIAAPEGPLAVHRAVASAARDVQTAGLACLPGVVTPDWLGLARALADKVNRSRAQEVLLEHLTAQDGAAVAAILSDRGLADFLEELAAVLHPAADPADRDLDVSLRVINGPDEAEHPLWFHYDATVLTLVVPIDIPEGAPGQSGELILYPNRRPFRKRVLTNIAEKCVMQSNTFRRRMPLDDATVVPLTPGNAYVFSGYRSYHATMPCPVGARRVTLMVHYKQAHPGSRILERSKALYHVLRGT